jgi:Na+/H+ ion antiporter subunit
VLARLPISGIIIWCLAFGSYLLFAGTVSVTELVTGLALGVFAASWATLIRENSRPRFGAAREQVAPLLSALAALWPATVRTGSVLCKVAVCGGALGRSIRARFKPGSRAQPRQCMRRALAVLCASLAPNRFVVDLERGRGEALLHAIDGSSEQADPEWLQ